MEQTGSWGPTYAKSDCAAHQSCRPAYSTGQDSTVLYTQHSVGFSADPRDEGSRGEGFRKAGRSRRLQIRPGQLDLCVLQYEYPAAAESTAASEHGLRCCTRLSMFLFQLPDAAISCGQAGICLCLRRRRRLCLCLRVRARVRVRAAINIHEMEQSPVDSSGALLGHSHAQRPQRGLHLPLIIRISRRRSSQEIILVTALLE